MKIGVVADPCDPQKPGGLGRCMFVLAKATVKAAPGKEFFVYSKSPFPVDGVPPRMLPVRVWLRGASTLDRSLDVYIFFTPVIPLFFKPNYSVVVAEDFAYLELPRRTMRERILALVTYQMHRRSLRMADKVVCISEATKHSAIEHFGIPAEKCVIAPLAAMPLANPLEVNGLPERFFLFAGILKERKNV